MCKICPRLGKICAEFYTVLSWNWVMLRFWVFPVILMAFYLVILIFTLKWGTSLNNYIIFASIDVWQSYFTHTCCQIHFTLFCCKFTVFFHVSTWTNGGKGGAEKGAWSLHFRTLAYCMCVIQDTNTIPWVNTIGVVNAMTLCLFLYHDSMSKLWVLVNNMSQSLNNSP